ncbi:centrosomal protein of 95 kDa isoform X2 [Mus musculus]|uniref:centrosomal protein of 95 kDa isoform X2 n=1 Tax=Mus musculus TaxID=10090 RepID=UPI00167658EE|nr:centrosomal protein of 95 kDa isoform X2 [Mus musculus]
MASSEAEWVTIANNLLFKCHIHLRIHELQDCDANVFIALYQSILGEKVPDLIVLPRNQEDEAHNVQAVIDSLALDYLQVSLSHITGENIVKGDNESIRNLLEIFDGLLDYLTEHISESSPNKSETEQYSKDSHGEEAGEDLERTEEAKWRNASFMRCSFSSDTLGPTWDEDEAESTGEIIRLGDTAHTFSQRSNGAQNSKDLRSRKASASPGVEPPEEMLNPGPLGFLSQNGPPCEAASETPPMSMVPSARKLGEPIRAAIPLHPPYHPSEPRAPCPIGKEYLWSSRYLSTPTSGEHMAPSVEPDDAFLTSTLFKDDDQETYLPKPEATRTRKPSKGERDENRAAIPSEHLPFSQKARKPLTEQELHAMSEKLSQRLSELDWALTEAFERELRKHKVQENVGLRGIREEEEEEEETGKSYREVVPKGTSKRSQVQKTYSRKTAAPSPKGDGRLKSSKASPMKVSEHSLLSLMLEQFPFLYVSDPTLTKMWKQQMAQVEQLKREAQRENRSKKKLQDEIEEALRRHDLLTALVKKEYDHNKRLQDFRDRIQRQRLTQSKIKENRHQSVRARKYYDDYRVQLRAKMMKMRTREEMIFKKLFEEGLQIQKQRLRDLRNYAKEKRNEEKRQHQNELDSMENHYKDQFSLLAEAISQERQELKVRQKFQAQTLHKVKRELRAKMEKEIQQLQHMITQNDDDAFFRELEAERFKARLQLASFQYSKNPFPRGQTS